jgi:hypothetical protein
MSNLIKFGVAAALAAVTVVAGAAEPAALLQQPQGKVFVSQGSAMVPVREGMAVAAGSRVVSLEGSQVNVTYADGCVLALPANSMLVLGQTRKCAQDLAAIRAVDGVQAVYVPSAVGYKLVVVAASALAPNPNNNSITIKL